MKRIIRKEKVTDEEAARLDKIRAAIREELPELIKQHEKRLKERETKQKN